jgi:YaiO family outer membrane protein
MAGELAGDFAHSRVVLGAAQGEREYGKNKTRRRAVQGLAQFSRDWGPQVTSVSQLSVASSSPVFAKLRVQQELELKPGGGTVVRLGGRFSRHVGGLEVRAGMVGASHSFGGAQVGYRLSAFNLPGKRSSAAHLFSFKLKDRRGSGSTFLSAVTGSSLHEIDWLSPVSEGRAHSLGAKRVQPLGAGLGVSLALGQTWYDQPAGTYRGTKVGFGLSFKR